MFGIVLLKRGKIETAVGIVPMKKDKIENAFGIVPIKRGKIEIAFGIVLIKRGQIKSPLMLLGHFTAFGKNSTKIEMRHFGDF